MIRSGSGTIDLPSLVEALWACAKEKRVRKVYQLAKVELPVNQAGIIRLCLQQGPEYAIDNILEEEDQLREFCAFLDLQDFIYDDDTRDKILSVILQNLSANEIKCAGAVTVLRNIELLKDTKEELSLPDIARRSWLFIEGLMIDMYYLYIAKYLYPFLKKAYQDAIRNSLVAGRMRFGNAIEQLIKYEEEIRGGAYPEFQFELERLNGQTSFFGQIDDLKTPLYLSEIRNKYLSHSSEHTRSEILLQCRRFYELARPYFEEIKEVFPIVITPLEAGINEWGFRYFAYIDESDTDTEGIIPASSALLVNGKIDTRKCKRLYFLENSTEFIPIRKAYCLYPDRSYPLCDPMLVYSSTLREIYRDLIIEEA